MKARRLLVSVLALSTCFPQAALAEGKLDLPLITPIRLPAEKAEKDIPPLPKELWAPGTPLAARGAGPFELGVASAGNAGLAFGGMAASARDFGRSREATAMTVGFGAIGALQLWNLWKVSTAPERSR